MVISGKLWELFHDHSRSPSILSEASDSSASFNSSSRLRDLAFDFSSYGSFSRSWRASPKLVLVSDFVPAIDIKEAYIVSPKLLGTGTFGSAYTAAMGNGVRIVVKRLSKSPTISEVDFKRHMDIVGNIRHENVVAVRAYYSSEDERLMLYDYYSNGSVYELIHGKTGESPVRVSWETRLKIAIGAARGIAAIHTQNGGMLVHGNIKATNIFLNSERYGCVSDLGLTNMIATTFMSKARCYAPEVKNTRDVSQASDVYSFGILLLELLTRKSPIHVPGGREVVNLVKLVGSVKGKEWAPKVFDADLLRNRTIREQMVTMLQVGIRCVEKSINKRPKISEVLKILEGLNEINTGKSVSSRELLFFEVSNATFELENMLRASAEVLGKGTFGTSYKARLDYGNTIMVKRLKDVNATHMEFQQHMEVIGRMRHENVAELRAYYFSKDDVLLVYDYQNQENISALLHGKAGESLAQVDWETRLKIAVGAARGIAAIHAQNGGKLVHGNIKATNVFLNSQHYGCVSDLGLTNMIATTFMSTARCYAPEVKNTRDVSQASDVYSFGILLLELLTRKSPIHVPGGREVVDLVKLVSSVKSKEWAAKVFDADLLKNPTIREQMVTMLQIGIRCVAKSIKKRPKTSEILKILEDLNTINTGNSVSSRAKLLFFEDSNATFELEDMLRASAEVLGKGTFGTSYKASLDNGNTIVVKRLKDVNATHMEFQQHMEVIGRLRHENVAELRAYYFTKEEVLLVYDYQNQETLSALLHGPGMVPLGWKTRLNIAVGAARGIAHIHQEDGWKLVHGNIKSSNIFLNGQNHSLVSDAGLAKVTNPIKRTVLQTHGHWAPEVNDSKKVSQASDVYSFGVVLLELVTGKPAKWTVDNFKVIWLVNWVQSFSRDDWISEVIDISLENLRYRAEEAASLVLQIAIDCVATVPESRPRMPEVVKILEEISGIKPSNDVSEDTWGQGQPSIESRLEDLLDDLLPTLPFLSI
ncbi:UNVERIFIED_CONTAM: putative inactive receptor kinase [Sesamum latifolium]|uniref:Inactive receptor kinase n=1 Tax=Sesamum latifolium TaxID=2727402 RepID=A0AAW2T8C2_9LAMI